MAFDLTTDVPYIFPELPPDGAVPATPGRQTIAGALRPGLRSTADSRPVNIIFLTSSRGAGFGGSGSPFHQHLAVALAQRAGGTTITPWSPPNTSGWTPFLIANRNGATENDNTWDALKLPPRWAVSPAPAAGAAGTHPQRILQEASPSQGYMTALFPGGENHDLAMGGRGGLCFPADYQDVGVKGRFIFAKSPTASEEITYAWRSHSTVVNTGSDPGTVEGTIDTSSLVVGSPTANPEPVVLESGAFNTANGFTSPFATCRIYSDAVYLSGDGPILLASCIALDGPKQYGIVPQSFGQGGHNLKSFPLFDAESLAQIVEAMGGCDIWAIEADNVNSYFATDRTAQEVHDEDLPALIAWCRSIADVPILLYTTYDTEHLLVSEPEKDDEFAQAGGVCASLVESGAAAALLNIDRYMRDVYGFTRENTALTPYFNLDTNPTWSDKPYAANSYVYHIGTQQYWIAPAGASIGQVPGTAPEWVSTRWVDGESVTAGQYKCVNIGRVIFGQWIANETHTATTSNHPGAGGAHRYWRPADLYYITDGAGTVSPTATARVHASNSAQRRFAEAFASLLWEAAFGGEGAVGKRWPV